MERRRKLVNMAKPFTITKRLVYEAFKAVKANAGAAGVDSIKIEGVTASGGVATATDRDIRGSNPR